MKMNLRRIAAWILTALLIVSCLPIQAIGQGREEYSAPVSFGNELDDGTDETKTLTFSWDDAYDSYAGFALWDNQQIYASVDNAQAGMRRVKEEAGEDRSRLFEEMRAINPDVRAWLTLDNTMIDYPVVQSTNNYRYLNMDVYGNFSLAGSIFADVRCDPDFRDRYTLVHGHHMAERKMFGDLDLYKDETFFWENRTGTLILEDRTYSLRTIACLVVRSVDEYIFNPTPWTDDIGELLIYARVTGVHYDDEAIERLLQENRDAKEGSRPPQIMALATCSSEYTDARTILLVEMIDLPAEE